MENLNKQKKGRREEMRKNKESNLLEKLNHEKGITLIALVVTIVVLLILAGITINFVLAEGGIFQRANDAKEAQEKAVYQDKIDILKVNYELGKAINEDITIDDFFQDLLDEKIIDNIDTGIKTNDNINYTIITPEGYEFNIKIDGESKYPVLANGRFDSGKGVNSPKLERTGLIPIYYGTNGQVIELTEESTDEEWEKWYDYSTEKKHWANAITKDSSENITGYFVWIPRYAYKITSGLYTSTAGKIEVKFLQGTENIDSEGNEISTTYPEVQGDKMTDYVVHPAFETDIANGGWNKDLSGFWVAKYPAGYQANTITDNNGTLSVQISNSSDTIIYSDKNYTSYNTEYIVNALNQDLTTKPIMSLPVFTPLTYAYNNISVGDSYRLAQEVASNSNFYGLDKVESHLMKNSEWGAVAYLTQSSYGISEEVNINNYFANNSAEGLFKVSITGIYADGTDIGATQMLGDTYYTEIGLKGSSTGNIYGIYDLNGGLWERTSGFISNGNLNLLEYGQALLDETGVTYDATQQTVTEETGESNEYITIYPYDKTNDTLTNNWTEYNKLKTTRFGDAILETSTAGSHYTSWNGNVSGYPKAESPFFAITGRSSSEFAGGIFSYIFSTGEGNSINCFRVCILAL